MNSYNENDVERIIKLVNEYTFRLKELIQAYQQQRKNRINFFITTLIGFLIIFGLFFIYFQFETNSISETKYMISIIVVVTSVIGLILFSYLNFQKSSRNSIDIIDEAHLIRKQLRQLIRIASQTREHIINFESLALLEIDLKLTEAEDMIERANRTFYLHKENNTNANTV